MADLVPLGTNFDFGFQSDTARDELNVRAAFRMVDYIPQLEAPLRKRGGWDYYSRNLNEVGGTEASINSMGWLPFPDDAHLVCVGNTGKLFSFRGASLGDLVTDTGDGTLVPTWPVFWHRPPNVSMGVILGGLGQGPKAPKKYASTGPGAYAASPLGGTPPLARMGFSWGAYLVLGNYYDPSDGNILKNYRWAFSPVGAPESHWELGAVPEAASTMDFPEEMIAGIPLLNGTLGWGYENCYLITGDTPPPGGNLAIKSLFAGVGTFDGRSVVGWRSYAIWANNSGVWMSDGATLTDLTSDGGISTFYRELTHDLQFNTGGSAVAGIYRDHYVITLSGIAQQTTLVCNLARKTWTTWSNFPAVCFAHRAAAVGTVAHSSDEELFFGHGSQPRVAIASTLWDPGLAFANDADGVPVQPSLETPFYRMGLLGNKRIRFVYAGYDMRVAGGNPRLRVSYTLSPEVEAGYTAMDSLPSTSTYKRKRVRVARPGLGFGLKFAQVGASAETRLYSLETEWHPWEATR